jgi:hypothetical protein
VSATRIETFTARRACFADHEELGEATAVHWSIPDPVPAGDPASVDAALAELSERTQRLAPRVIATA